MKVGDLIDVPAPRIAIKMNLATIDKFVHTAQSKVGKVPGEQERAV